MDTEFKYGKMEQNMKEIGNLIKRMDKEKYHTPMETFTRENGLQIKLTGMENIFIKMEINIWANG
jgi:hypothetical protein